ncbi:OmpA family protein [bacterium]|nr:OmpA family protein [bacterium]
MRVLFCGAFILGMFYLCFFVQTKVCAVSDTEISDAKKPYIVEEILKTIPKKDTITYTVVPRGIILSVAQEELFTGNSDKLSDNGKIILQYIANMLNNFNNNCTIEAHTEELLKQGFIYKEDWEISIVRANAIFHYLVDTLNVDSGRIFPIGFGKIMPFKGNVSPVDFADNRIDFVIFDYTVSR